VNLAQTDLPRADVHGFEKWPPPKALVDFIRSKDVDEVLS
jgi:hypothetical protein